MRRSGPATPRRSSRARACPLLARRRAGGRDGLRPQTGKQVWRQSYDAPYQMNPAADEPRQGAEVDAGRRSRPPLHARHQRHPVARSTPRRGALWRKTSTRVRRDLAGFRRRDVAGRRRRPRRSCTSAATRAARSWRSTAPRGAVKWSWKADGPPTPRRSSRRSARHRQVVTQTRAHVVGLSAADGAAALEVPVHDRLRPEHHHAGRRRRTCSSTPASKADHGDARARVGGEVDAERSLERMTSADVHELAGAVGRLLFGLTHRNRGQFFAVDANRAQTLWTTTRDAKARTRR